MSDSRGKTTEKAPPEEEIDLAVVDEIVAECGHAPDQAIPILQAIQEHFRYLPREALERVCEISEITPSQLSGALP